MAFVVAITCTMNPRAVVIRTSWIFGFTTTNFNNGINRNQTHSIFYSTDLERQPDFSLGRRGFFEREPDAVYDARLFRFFDNELEAIVCKIEHRYGVDGMPAVYNPRRVHERPLPQIIRLEQNLNEAIVEQNQVENDIPEVAAHVNEGVMLPNEPQAVAHLHEQNDVPEVVARN